MTPRKFQELLLKWRNPLNRRVVPPHAVTDIDLFLNYITTVNRENRRLRDELSGATATTIALVKALGVNGEMAIPFKLVEQVDPEDTLQVSDRKYDDGHMVKVFSVKQATPVPEEAAPSKIVLVPKGVH